jgi:pyochelin biosynthetic protein PchC
MHRLVCFPHAGGSASFYRDWGTHLAGIEVHAVCYPGRAGRITEPPPTDLRQLAREVADAVQPLADRSLALFGHSMGAPVALETARLLESRGVRLSHLFASGSRDAECVALDPADLAQEDPAELIARLVTLGGTDTELAADPDFQDLVLPYVLGDSHMFHRYEPEPEPVLRCPVTSIVGDADPDADRRPWSTLTSGGFRERVVHGDHFYLIPDPPFAEIRRTLESTRGTAGSMQTAGAAGLGSDRTRETQRRARRDP